MKLYQKAEQALLNGLRTGKSTNIRRTKNFVIRLLFYLVVFDLAFVFLYPFITVIADSLKTDNDIVNITVKWLPSSPEWNNYVVAWKRLRYLKYFKNSAIVCGTATLGHVFSCSFAGYAFARYQFRFKNLLFGIVVLAMLVPAQVLIFPLYMQFSNWGWTNTYLPLAVPTFFGFGLSGGFFIGASLRDGRGGPHRRLRSFYDLFQDHAAHCKIFRAGGGGVVRGMALERLF